MKFFDCVNFAFLLDMYANCKFYYLLANIFHTSCSDNQLYMEPQRYEYSLLAPRSLNDEVYELSYHLDIVVYLSI